MEKILQRLSIIATHNWESIAINQAMASIVKQCNNSECPAVDLNCFLSEIPVILGTLYRIIETVYPSVVNSAKVGKYKTQCYSGGGYFYDELLEYRVWHHPYDGGDELYCFPNYLLATMFSEKNKNAGHSTEEPIALVLQREWVDHPSENEYVAKKGERITEWKPEWLEKNKRPVGLTGKELENVARMKQEK